MSTSGSGRDDRPLPLWPSGPPAPSAPLPPPPPPSPVDDDGWPDPPSPVWPEYQPPPKRKRTVPVLLGVVAALVLLAGAGVAAVVLLGHPSTPATTAGAAPVSAAPVVAATPSAVSSSAPSSPPASGALAKGDCVEVTSTSAGALDNAKRTRQDCSGAHFAIVVGTGATRDDCPANVTISRIEAPDGVVCLGQDSRAAIAKPGDCVRVPTTFALPLIRTDCASSNQPFRLDAITDDASQCPTGTRGAPYSGYDRVLCVRGLPA